MTAKEIQKRNEKAQQLKVIQADERNFYVESAEGKVCYKVVCAEEGNSCTCGDFARGVKNDPQFKCKHILSVLSSVPNGEVESAQVLERKKPKLDESFITEIEGREFVVYAGLLDLAHQKGLLKLEADPVQYPTPENGNVAICRALGETKLGETFRDVGDADPTNCNSKVRKHIIRLASTRAKARVLRDMTNIGITCLEELGDLSDVIGESEKPKRGYLRKAHAAPLPQAQEKEAQGKKDQSQETPVQEDKPPEKNEGKVVTKPSATPKEEKKTDSGNGDSPKMSEAQKRAVYNLSRRRGVSIEELEKMSQEAYGVSIDFLSSRDASAFIRQLQQSA